MPIKKFSHSKTITRQNLEKVPANKPGVYRIKNAKGTVLYIGKAKGGRLPDRIAEHKGEFKKGSQFQYITTANKEAAEKRERQEIRKYMPPKNKNK